MLGHYLMFNRNCAEALDVYVNAFDASISVKQTYGDMPPNADFPVSEADKGLVLHAQLVIDGSVLMCADSVKVRAGNNMYVEYTTHDGAIVQKAWDMLKDGGEIYMELAPSFFAAAHGSLRDRFGVNWMFTVTK